MRLLLLTAAALMGGGTQTISGTISANSGNAITVSSADRSVTCFVPDRGAAVILKWGLGVRVGMACKQTDGRLVLTALKRLGVKEPQRPTTTPTKTEPTKTLPTNTEPTRTEPTKTEPTRTQPTTTTSAPTPTAPTQQRREARGVVIALAPNYGVALQPDGGGELLKCAITSAPDSQQAATKLTLNGHFGIVCRLDGGRYVLAGSTPIS